MKKTMLLTIVFTMVIGLQTTNAQNAVEGDYRTMPREQLENMLSQAVSDYDNIKRSAEDAKSKARDAKKEFQDANDSYKELNNQAKEYKKRVKEIEKAIKLREQLKKLSK